MVRKQQVIRITREQGYECSPRGVYHHFPPGDYVVPGEMSPEIARRALESNIGREVDAGPENKAKAPAAKKKRASAKKTGKARS